MERLALQFIKHIIFFFRSCNLLFSNSKPNNLTLSPSPNSFSLSSIVRALNRPPWPFPNTNHSSLKRHPTIQTLLETRCQVISDNYLANIEGKIKLMGSVIVPRTSLVKQNEKRLNILNVENVVRNITPTNNNKDESY